MTRASGEVSGTVMLRPVRVGLAMMPTMGNLLRAVDHATSCWGGIYFPMLASDDEVMAQEQARAFSVDVIAAVDDGELRELYVFPQGHGSMAYSVLTCPLVFMDSQDRLRWKFVNYLWEDPKRPRVRVRSDPLLELGGTADATRDER